MCRILHFRILYSEKNKDSKLFKKSRKIEIFLSPRAKERDRCVVVCVHVCVGFCIMCAIYSTPTQCASRSQRVFLRLASRRIAAEF